MNVKTNTTKTKIKPKFIVVREYLGRKTMKEAFEEIITDQANSRFDKWKDKQKIQ